MSTRPVRRLAALVATVATVIAAVGVIAVRIVDGALPAQAQEPALVITRNESVSFSGVSEEPVFVLIIGNDERRGVGGRRADALHVVGLNATAGEATVVNIPRDTVVTYPDGSQHRINEGNPRAQGQGDPNLQTRLVSELVGVPIAFTVEANFAGFVGMVDDLGGIEVDVPFRMRDSASGARFDAGLQRMDGAAALAFSRNRNIRGGDFQRTADQALVILAALAKVQAARPDISESLRLVGVFMKHGELHGTSATDLVHLSRLALGIQSGAIRNEVVPSRTGRLGTGSVVYSLPEAQDLFADLRDNAILDTYKTLASVGSPQSGN